MKRFKKKRSKVNRKKRFAESTCKNCIFCFHYKGADYYRCDKNIFIKTGDGNLEGPLLSPDTGQQYKQADKLLKSKGF